MTVDLDELERAANAIRPDQRGVPAFSAENVLALIADSRHLKAELAAARAAALEEAAKCCDAFDGPVSDSDFVNGQATAAQQIRAAILAEAQKDGG